MATKVPVQKSYFHFSSVRLSSNYINSRTDLFDGTNYVITKNWGGNFLIAVQKVDGKNTVLGTGIFKNS